MVQRVHCSNCGYPTMEEGECSRCEGQAALLGKFPIPDPGQGFVKNLFFGIQYFMIGFSFTGQNPKLYKYILIPLFINLLIFAGLIVGGIYCLDPLMSFMDAEWPGFIEWLRTALYWVIYVLFLLLLICVSFFLTFLLSTVINSPFFEILSEKVEDLFIGRELDEPWSWDYIVRTILVPLKESIKLAVWQLFITGIIFVVSLLSAGLGTVLFAVAGPYFASMAIFDFVMARKTYQLHEKRGFLKTHFSFIMGFGAPVYFLPFLTPFSVVGATLGFLSARRK